MGIKYEQLIEGADGWTDWIKPHIGHNPPYRIACCDCGLVHELEFAMDDEGELLYRARQNARSTAQRRRHMKR